MNVLKSIAGKTRTDRVRIDEIRDERGTVDLYRGSS